MNEALIKVRKRLKWDTAVMLVVIILLFALAGSSIAQAIIQGTKDRSSFLTVVIGVVLGMISEIFMYGCAVQEDLDQIA